MVDVLVTHPTNVRCKGFYTEEVVRRTQPEGMAGSSSSSSSRIGFDVVTIPDYQRGILARKDLSSKFRTGPYGVDLRSFESLALPSLSSEEDGVNVDLDRTIFVLDEIGRMELHSKRFQEQVMALLDQGIRLIGAVTAPRYGHRVPFCDYICAQEGVHVFHLTKKTRDDTVHRLVEMIQREWIENEKSCDPKPDGNEPHATAG